MRQVLLLFLFLRGETEAQRFEVNGPGYSVDEQEYQVLNLSLPGPLPYILLTFLHGF